MLVALLWSISCQSMPATAQPTEESVSGAGASSYSTHAQGRLGKLRRSSQVNAGKSNLLAADVSRDEKIVDEANKAFFTGDYAAARSALQRMLKVEGSSSEKSEDARLFINLGILTLALNDAEKGLDYFGQAKKLLDKQSQPKPLDSADCLMGLAECQYAVGQTKLASRNYSEALSLYQKHLGRWHPDSIPALEGLAGCHYLDNNFDIALSLYEHVARIDLKQWGPEHPRVGLSINNLAEIKYKLDDCSSSRAYYEQALWIFKKCALDRLMKKMEAEQSTLSEAERTVRQKRIVDFVMGTKAPPAIAERTFNLLKDKDFDSTKATFALRPKEFDSWSVGRRGAEETLYVSIDASVPQKGTIVCLHGLGLHSKSFSGFADKINPFGYSVIGLDVRGFGSFAMEKGLDRLDLDSGLEDLAASVSLFRDHSPNTPIFVLGESMGGALAVQLAAKYPDYVTGLVSAVPSGRRFKSASTGLLVGIKLLEDKNKPIEIGKKIIEQSTVNQQLRDVWMNDPGARLKLSAEELVRFNEFMNQTEKVAREIKQTPVIIFQGFKDHLVKPEGTIALYGALATPQKDLVLVGDREHLIFEEGQSPNDIVRMLAAWLDCHLEAPKQQQAVKP